MHAVPAQNDAATAAAREERSGISQEPDAKRRRQGIELCTIVEPLAMRLPVVIPMPHQFLYLSSCIE